MSEHPRVSPGVLASIADSAPDRVRRKLDKNPAVAQEWDWLADGSAWIVEAGGEQVRLLAVENQILQVEHVTCSCLLTPRCFHVLAVLSVLDLAEGIVTEVPSTPAEESESTELLSTGELTDAQRAAALATWKAAAAILATGARAAGTLLQSHLLRAIHETRCQGLHRLAAGGLRVMQNVRLLRETDDSFRSEDLLSDLTELLRVAWKLSRAQTHVDGIWLGVARRAYAPQAALRLEGLCTEPILTRSGYSGVVTYLLAQDGTICSVSNVRPGGTERIQEAWQTGADLGMLSLPHRLLNRQALLVQKGTRSADGRLGGGKDCRAVTTEAAGWNSERIAERFRQPLEAQVHQIFQADTLASTDQPAGWDLLFLEGTILGSDGEGLLLSAANEPAVLRLRIALDHPACRYRENLDLLARVPGLNLRCIARMETSSPGDALALALAPAVAPDGAEEQCRLPKDFNGHVNLGVEQLERGFFQTAQRQASLVAQGELGQKFVDGLDFVRRRLQAVALGGRHALPTGRVREAVSDANALHAHLQPTASALLRGLAECALESQTDLLGQRFPADPSHLAEHWLAGATYEETARRHFQKWGWLQTIHQSEGERGASAS